VPDAISEEIWRQHEEWLWRHEEQKRLEWMRLERWSAEDWSRAQELTEGSWEDGFYVFTAIRALEQVHWERLERSL
jgi:hypothetical protein